MTISQMYNAVSSFCDRNNIQFSFLSYKVNHSDFIYPVSLNVWVIDGIEFVIESSDILMSKYEGDVEYTNFLIDYIKKLHLVLITDDKCRSMFGKPNSTESNGFRYENKCPYPLIGVDINLFKEDIEFPYHKDRPKCFYDVIVDGKISSHQAFYDEKLRWAMIENRIEYSGGFIDANQVLYALNVTRNCKQPSWFSKSFAQHIISTYCTSEIIVDPFAGWGARYDAALSLKRKYIGIDFNKELVDWHHEKGRSFIGFGDATEFRYNEECSVFICPPYSDPKNGRCFEDYNFDGFDDRAKALSQCDWLKIVMKNVPNASEYVMVCKIVDPGWDKYIVETKTNKSHFGKNNEYVIRVLQSQKEEALSM